MSQGRIIAVEGINRTGKSRLLQRLAAELRHRGHDVRTTHEFDCRVGKVTKELLSQPDLTPDTRALLYAATRLDSLQQNGPLLEQGITLLYDRYLWSTYAYHHSVCTYKFILGANSTCRVADFTVLLDADPEALLQRRPASKLGNQFVHDLAYQQQVREAFLSLAKVYQDKCVVLDALQGPSKILRQAVTAVCRFLETP